MNIFNAAAVTLPVPFWLLAVSLAFTLYALSGMAERNAAEALRIAGRRTLLGRCEDVKRERLRSARSPVSLATQLIQKKVI